MQTKYRAGEAGMIGDDATGRDSESMTPEPTAPEALHISASPFADTNTRRPADMPWSDVPAGRRISFTAWGVAGIVGIVLWMVIIKLF
jgi:hypothetical protein